MITLDNYGKILGGKRTIGQVHKQQADLIMEKTWWRDTASRVGYFYQYKDDTHIQQLNDLNPENDPYKIPLDIKFIVASSQTYSKDAITYHLQLRPSQSSDEIPYYKELFGDRYDATFPVGLYCDIPDNNDKWQRWLVVATANVNDPQFSTYELLRCDKVINWILDGKKFYMPGVLRSQNSYNSGIWTSGRSALTIPEDQSMFILPMNRNVEKIYYNQRIVLDNKVLSEPRLWKLSKINRLDSNGVAIFTCAQDKYNPNADYLDEDGYWWADYFDATTGQIAVQKETESINNVYGVINCVGSQNIKVHGSYKKFSISYFNGDKPIEPVSGNWHFFIDGIDAFSLVQIKTDGLQPNEIKIKFLGESDYIGKELNVRYVPTIGDVIDFYIPVISL